ncbi:MAG: ABC transporter substrate-binding protein [Candidatus Omnitrophota bacterium]
MRIIKFGISVWLICVLVCTIKAIAGPDGQIKLGVLIDRSGKTKDVGQQAWLGVEDYFKYLNENGGINGKKIKILMRDTGYYLLKAKKYYRDLKKEGVVGIIGWGTGTSKTLISDVNKDGIPWLPGSMAESLVDPIKPYNFILGPSYKDQYLALIKYAHDNPKVEGRPVRVAFLYNSSEFGLAPIEPAEKMVEELGMDLVGKEIVELDAQEADQQIQRLARLSPDYLIIQETGNATVAILNSCHKAGLKTAVLGTFYSGDAQVLMAAADALEIVDLYFVSPICRKCDRNELIMQRINEFLITHRPGANFDANIYYVQGWIMGTIFTEAIRRCGNDVTALRVRDALESLTDFDSGGVMGNITFSPSDHKGSDKIKVYKANPESLTFEEVTDWMKF